MTGQPVLPSIQNFRDFGGFETASGQRMGRGRLYRSAAQHEATDEDLAVLARLDLGVIVDLRHPSEREFEVCRRWPGFAADVIENDWEDTFPNWTERLKGQAPTVELLRKWKRLWYGQMATAPGRIDLFARCLAALADSDRPILIHCSAGKDRTGVLVALVQHVAGVGWDDVVTDFLRSNNEAMFRHRAPGVRADLERIAGTDPDPATVRAAMAVEADYLEIAFEGMTSQYGSVDAYLEQALALGAAERETLQARLLG